MVRSIGTLREKYFTNKKTSSTLETPIVLLERDEIVFRFYRRNVPLEQWGWEIIWIALKKIFVRKTAAIVRMEQERREIICV